MRSEVSSSGDTVLAFFLFLSPKGKRRVFHSSKSERHMCSIYVHMCSVFTPVDKSVNSKTYKGLLISTGHKINTEGHKINATGHKINMTGHKINTDPSRAS